MKNNECNNAIKNIFTKINIDPIIDFINNINCMSDTRKEFYKEIIKGRYKIIKTVYEKL